ncbi:ubiquitin-specific protease 18 [Prunus dulcis]|uniref:Ubiquitin-specific protease 18 n=1 Tax=Prunus dulcis TaxID=3755 RepID=A0A4Y1QT84_PRUDU|nr:ubiquitin-specific protease 18 [Prunus dulcis]
MGSRKRWGKTFSGLALVPIRGISKHIKKPKELLCQRGSTVSFIHSAACCLLVREGPSERMCSPKTIQCYFYVVGICEDWCFLCEFQTHLERASQSSQAFSPTNIISRLPNIGGNLVHGRQEDAHELMRFAIDTMQSVCLSEFGGEKAVHPSTQETTIIQHIFGGLLQSQVICTKCKNISNRYDNMMDLTVEIHGDASSLEECLDQFTIKEWLDGENKYKCDGCNDYVKAWKRLTVKRTPNILTIALKRFQLEIQCVNTIGFGSRAMSSFVAPTKSYLVSGRFGKINKRVTFPETLDLNPYMSETGDGANIYKLYAVVVHVDMLNASFFGHYICYTKDFGGNWYRIDDCKVATVNLEEVLSQGAYMLLYSRVQPRASCLTLEPPRKTEEMIDVEVQPCRKEQVECSTVEPADSTCHSGFVPSDTSLPPQISSCVEDSSAVIIPEAVRERSDNADLSLKSPSSVPKEVCIVENNTLSSMSSPSVSREREISSCEKVPAGKLDLDTVRGDPVVIAIPNGESCRPVLDDVSARCEKYLSSSGGEYVNGNSEDMDIDNCQSGSSVAEDIGICKNNGPTYADGITSPVAHSGFLNGNGVCRVEKKSQILHNTLVGRVTGKIGKKSLLGDPSLVKC